MDDHSTIWRRLDEHGEHLHELRTRVGDMATRHAAYDADMRSLRAQLTDMRDRQLVLENQGAERHAEIMRRLDSLASYKSGVDAVKEYKREALKWAVGIVGILVALGFLGRSVEAAIPNKEPCHSKCNQSRVEGKR